MILSRLFSRRRFVEACARFPFASIVEHRQPQDVGERGRTTLMRSTTAASTWMKPWPRSRCMSHRAAPLGSVEAMASVHRHDHVLRNTMLRLFAGISVITGAENPADCAIAATASRSRRPQVGVRSQRLRSNAWLLGAVANPARLYGP
jgi:hypothetical protein